MGRLETNDWIILNNIIYDIYTTRNTEDMQKKFLDRIAAVIDYDGADFCIASKEDGVMIADAVAVGLDSQTALRYDDIDYSRDIMYSGRSLVYRESDIMPEEKRINTEYYRKVYKANGFHYSIQMILGSEGKFLGVVTLYRRKESNDFDYYDIFTLDILKDHMAYSLNQRSTASGDLNDSEAVGDFVERYSLTRREEEVLRHMILRQDNVTISDNLSISLNTLKKHERNIYQKCGVSSRMQLFKLVSTHNPKGV